MTGKAKQKQEDSLSTQKRLRKTEERLRQETVSARVRLISTELDVVLSLCKFLESATAPAVAERNIQHVKTAYRTAIRLLTVGLLPPQPNKDIAQKVADAQRSLAQTLHTMKERFPQAVWASKMFAYRWDRVTDTVVCSGNCRQFLGLDQDTLVVGEQMISRVHREDRKRVLAAIAQSSPKQPYVRVHYRMRRPDGAVIWVENSSQASFDAKGRMLREVGIIADITGRKEKEEARIRYTAIVESSEDAIIDKTPDGVISAWNAGAEVMFGYTKKEAIGQPIAIIVPPELLGEEDEFLHRWRAGERMEHRTTRRISKDGRTIDVSLTVSPLRDAKRKIIGVSSINRDVTENKLTRAALVESQERFELAMNNVASGLYTLDLQGLVTYVNPAAEAMFGWTNAELLGKKMHDVTHYKHPDGTPFPASDCPGLQILEKGVELREHEDMFIRKDGSFFPVVFSASPLKKEDNLAGVVVGFRDDTQQRQAEQELAAANERLRLAIESGSAGGWDWDIKSGKNQWFGNAHAQLGMSPEETAGSREEFWDHVHEDDRKHLRSAMAAAMEKHGQFNEEFRVVWRDGTIHWLRSRGRFYYAANGEPERMLGISSDITERRQADQAVRESEERFRLVANTAPVMIWMSGTDKLCNYFNKFWLDFTGRSMNSELGNGWADGVHPEDLRRCMNTYVQAFDRREEFRMQYRLRRHDGEYRWILDTGVPRFHKDGQFAGYIGSCVDVTETLRGILTVCSYCKKVQADLEMWTDLENYVRKHSEAEFSHGVCPDCFRKISATIEQGNGVKVI